MAILFFDCETNGKPINWKAPMTEVNNWPRVIQLAWEIADHTGAVLNKAKELIYPDGWTIPEEKFWIENGYSTKTNLEKGIPITTVLSSMVDQVNEFSVHGMVSHNLAFDVNVLGAEMIRYDFKVGRKLKQYCTMVYGTDVCKLPGNFRGQFKWPKLSELYSHLFQKDFEGAHDAGADVSACRECFFELVKRGVIRLDSHVINESSL